MVLVAFRRRIRAEDEFSAGQARSASEGRITYLQSYIDKFDHALRSEYSPIRARRSCNPLLGSVS